MATGMKKLSLQVLLLGFVLAYAALVLGVTKKLLFPPWYHPGIAGSVAGSKILQPCSSYQKRVYIYCGNPRSDLNFDFQEAHEEVIDRERIMGFDGWWIEAGAGSGAVTSNMASNANIPIKGAVILIPGAGADRRAMMKHVTYLKPAGYHTLLMDPLNHGLAPNDGHGLSYGYWEQRSIIRAHKWIRREKKFKGPIYWMGTSQGAVAALMADSTAAVEDRPVAIVAENPSFSLMRAMHDYPQAKSIPSMILAQAVVLMNFWHGAHLDEAIDATNYAPLIKDPALVIHGENDQIGRAHV